MALELFEPSFIPIFHRRQRYLIEELVKHAVRDRLRSLGVPYSDTAIFELVVNKWMYPVMLDHGISYILNPNGLSPYELTRLKGE